MLAVAGIASPLASAKGLLNPYGVVVVPAAPMSGQPFVVRVDAPDCIYIDELRSVTLSGSDIEVAVDFITPLPGLPGCTLGVLIRHEWTVGPFPPGTYTLSLVGIHPDFNTREDTLGEIALTIDRFAAQQPNLVPTGRPVGWVMLSLMLGVGGILVMRARAI